LKDPGGLGSYIPVKVEIFKSDDPLFCGRSGILPRLAHRRGRMPLPQKRSFQSSTGIIPGRDMAIIINLDVMLARKKVKSKELAEFVGITEQNLSLIKTGKVKGIRLATLNSICKYLECQPGDLLQYQGTGPEDLS
jgi:putative transcriptional regulator